MYGSPDWRVCPACAASEKRYASASRATSPGFRYPKRDSSSAWTAAIGRGYARSFYYGSGVDIALRRSTSWPTLPLAISRNAITVTLSLFGSTRASRRR
jgi:hypothetical protein